MPDGDTILGKHYMPFLDYIRNSRHLRWPLIAVNKLLLSPLSYGPALLRRAAYDAVPTRYLVTGNREYFIVSTSDKVIGRELFLRGEFDFWKLQAAMAIMKKEGLPPPTHIIDVGANIGTIVIPALKRGLMQSATAIEPHPDNLRLLNANLALNSVSHLVEVHGVAVGIESGHMLKLEESATNSGNHSIGTKGISVPSIRLDDLKIPSRDALLWMDIEGYEGHALTGAVNLLSSGAPIVSEFNHSLLSRSNGLDLFRNAIAGRRIFDLNDPTQEEITEEKLFSKYIHAAQYTDILALPTKNA